MCCFITYGIIRLIAYIVGRKEMQMEKEGGEDIEGDPKLPGYTCDVNTSGGEPSNSDPPTYNIELS